MPNLITSIDHFPLKFDMKAYWRKFINLIFLVIPNHQNQILFNHI
jgi:hypothetical protein